MALSRLAVKVCTKTPDPGIENNRKARLSLYDGNINFSTADNALSAPLVYEKLSQCNDWALDAETLANYRPLGGDIKTRKVVADFINHFMHPAIDVEPSQLVIMPGVTSLLDTMATVCANPGETILCPSPQYVRIGVDMSERAGVKVHPVDMLTVQADGSLDWSLSVPRLEAALREVEHEEGGRVRAILLVNPDNPTGAVHGKEELMAVVEWAMSHGFLVIMNEIYALSVYDKEDKEGGGALSVVDSILQWLPHLSRPENVVWLWGTSKDFCVPGIRCGVAFSLNKRVLYTLEQFSLLQPVSASSELIAVNLLTDFDWIRQYVTENHANLRKASAFALGRLAEMKVATVIKPRAGFFMLIDLRHLLRLPSFECEAEVESRLQRRGVFTLAGGAQEVSVPGLFRIVFTTNHESLVEGLRRLREVVQEVRLEFV